MSETPVEIAWFSALCDDDYEVLGVPETQLRSSFDHCLEITRRAEAGDFDNILLPSGYHLGVDGVTFAAGVAATLLRLPLLLAVRCGEMWPPQLARQLASLDEMLGGRLTLNIISSDLPGSPLDPGPRYRRTLEVMKLLRQWMAGEPVAFAGEFHAFDLEPPGLCARRRRCPPFYFGGLSDEARDVAAREADVFLMWPDTVAGLQAIVSDMRKRAAQYDRTLRFGYRVHVIVRETESEAKEAAKHLMSGVDDAAGEEIRRRSLDHASEGVRRQAQLRSDADTEGYAEDHLFTGIGRARSGCGAALVGDPDQVLGKLRAYRSLGIESFILSGYPHADECDRVARYILPRIEHAPIYVEKPTV